MLLNGAGVGRQEDAQSEEATRARWRGGERGEGQPDSGRTHWMRAWISAGVMGNERKKGGKREKEEYPLHHCVTGNLIEGLR